MSLLFSDASLLQLGGVIGFIETFFMSSISGKIIVVMLLLGSIWAWTLMVMKGMELANANRISELFLMEFRELTTPLALYDDDRLPLEGSPLREIYHKTCLAVVTSHAMTDGKSELEASAGQQHFVLPEHHMNAVRSAAENSVAAQAIKLEKDMVFLATAASAAPFLGLLGTVMGIMQSFGSMANSGPALLSDVAPGIAAALLTTVVGLLVALPSSIGYNVLSDKVRRLTVTMDSFAQELVADIERIYVKKS